MRRTGAERPPAGKEYRIGVPRWPSATDDFQERVGEALREQGYVQGRNVIVEWRWADARRDRAAQLARETERTLGPPSLLLRGDRVIE